MLEDTSEDFNRKVCQKFNTSIEQVNKDVEILKEWIKQQPHLPKCSSNTLLTNFVIACKNSLERAKEKIDNYYTARLNLPDFFSDRGLEDQRSRLSAEEMRVFSLPKFTPDGYHVHMMAFVTGDPQKFDLTAVCRRYIAYGDIILNIQPFSMGEYVIIDCKNTTLSHLLWITPTAARDMMYCVQDVFPIIVKGVILINAPPYAESALNIIKPFIKKKLLQKFRIHTEGPEILEKYFPKKMLPRDYGGEEKSSEELHASWEQLLREKKDWLINEGSTTVDESKRLGGSKIWNGLGFQEIQGTFKTLCVD